MCPKLLLLNKKSYLSRYLRISCCLLVSSDRKAPAPCNLRIFISIPTNNISGIVFLDLFLNSSAIKENNEKVARKYVCVRRNNHCFNGT